MLQENFYPHPVSLPIDLIQTHISYVFLTGDYAYKLKKPVSFGFLDFSTPAKRHHFTKEELRLNQPVAPDIYLEILSITQTNEEYQLEGKGELREYVLKMRQFPQENLLINLLKQGLLQAEHCQQLAKVVASFHNLALTNAYINSFGSPEKIKTAIEENYEYTTKYVGVIQSQLQYQETKAFTDRFLIENIELFTERQVKGKIREGHGDLHLKNICLYQDKIQLFDRIEFNEEFRYVDVIYDIAFAVMDLDFHQAKELSNIFLNTYLELTGDWEGVQVLPLYLVRQAYVRAKVNSFTSEDTNLTEAEKAQAKIEAIAYYHLAWQYTQPHQGKITLMSGLSGSGKSTVARKLAKTDYAIHIRSDAVRKHLGGIPPEAKGEEELYSPEMTEKTYNRLLELGIKLAKQGYPVILDAKYDRRRWRERAIATTEAEKIPLRIYHCTAPLAVLRERLAQRTGDVSDATPDLLEQQLANREEFTSIEQPYVTNIDTNQNKGIVSIVPEKG
nr:bifunctional aminoglycoside phosphotransferase/ATP-binding protein [Gloeocapsa sp. PCC 73106]